VLEVESAFIAVASHVEVVYVQKLRPVGPQAATIVASITDCTNRRRSPVLSMPRAPAARQASFPGADRRGQAAGVQAAITPDKEQRAPARYVHLTFSGSGFESTRHSIAWRVTWELLESTFIASAHRSSVSLVI
jgi:hypothetical protein